jgi:hypothetical protein
MNTEFFLKGVFFEESHVLKEEVRNTLLFMMNTYFLCV